MFNTKAKEVNKHKRRVYLWQILAFKATAFKSHGSLGRTRKVAVIYCVIVDRREIIISATVYFCKSKETVKNKSKTKAVKKKEKERKNKNDKARALASNPERCASLIPDNLG